MISETIKTFIDGVLAVMSFGMWHAHVTNQSINKNNIILKEQLKKDSEKLDRYFKEQIENIHHKLKNKM